jgi:hypothetical protein
LFRTFPDAHFVQAAREALRQNLTAENIVQEAASLRGEGRSSFERPYGLAPSAGFGIVQMDKEKNLIHFDYIDGRDMNEPAADMHLPRATVFKSDWKFSGDRECGTLQGTQPNERPSG